MMMGCKYLHVVDTRVRMAVRLWRLNPLVGSNRGASTNKIGLEIVQLSIVSNGRESQTYVPTSGCIIRLYPVDDAETVTWMMMMEARVCLFELMCAFDHSADSCPSMNHPLPD